MSDFLQDAWYVAGWTHELEGNRTLARTIVDHPLVFYRAAGEAWCACWIAARTASRPSVWGA
jgi:phenylpropionate dioxygenase-like ring-hydroxylating dioxygenase large terminal subunit